jgi:hypothetical protein
MITLVSVLYWYLMRPSCLSYPIGLAVASIQGRDDRDKAQLMTSVEMSVLWASKVCAIAYVEVAAARGGQTW